MPERIALRELTPQERAELERIASARTAPADLVERAAILLGAADGRSVGRIAHEAGVSRPTVSARVRRFNDGGLAALGDRPRSGRPPTYGADQRAAVVAAALTDPRELGLPFASRTLDRLRAYLNERKGIATRRSRIDELLTGEGLRRRHRETWFGERVDPDFAARRGRSSGSTPPRRRARPSSASTRWGRNPPRANPGQRVVRAGPGRGDDGTPRHAGRARQEADYGRRGKGYIFGAFRPATGEALTAPYASRGIADWVDFPERAEAWVPADVGRVYAIVGNLSAHRATDVLLFCLAHPRWEFAYQPKYAAYLNLIEPWWRALRSLALKGRRFETWEEVCQAFEEATAYWNKHRHPFVWGRRRRHRPRRKPGIAAVPSIRGLAG